MVIRANVKKIRSLDQFYVQDDDDDDDQHVFVLCGGWLMWAREGAQRRARCWRAQVDQRRGWRNLATIESE